VKPCIKVRACRCLAPWKVLQTVAELMKGEATTQVAPTDGTRLALVPHLLLQPWVQRITQAIAEQVEAEHGDENRNPWENRDPGVVLDEYDVSA
jgi:hypothetical protein